MPSSFENFFFAKDRKKKAIETFLVRKLLCLRVCDRRLLQLKQRPRARWNAGSIVIPTSSSSSFLLMSVEIGEISHVFHHFCLSYIQKSESRRGGTQTDKMKCRLWCGKGSPLMDDVETLDESSGKTMRLSIDRDIADPVDGLHEPIASLDPRSIYNYGHLPFS